MEPPPPLAAERTPAARSDRLALGAAFITVVLWASAFVGIRKRQGRVLRGGPSRSGGCWSARWC